MIIRIAWDRRIMAGLRVVRACGTMLVGLGEEELWRELAS